MWDRKAGRAHEAGGSGGTWGLHRPTSGRGEQQCGGIGIFGEGQRPIFFSLSLVERMCGIIILELNVRTIHVYVRQVPFPVRMCQFCREPFKQLRIGCVCRF